MRIKALKLQSGEQVELVNNITVFVGPNNSGKSQTLKDIRSMMDKNRSGHLAPIILMNDDTVFDIPSYGEIVDYIDIKESRNGIDQFVIEGIVSDLLSKETINIHKSQLDSIGAKNVFFEWFSKYYLALMNAESRLKLASQVGSFNTEEEHPGNLVQALLLDSDAEKRLQEAFKSAFGEDIKLDYSLLQFLCLRVAEELPEIPSDVRDAIKITKKLPKIDDQGDGFRSFAGIILGLLLSKKRIILLDEPEAFLHPAQSYCLGKWIGDNGDFFQSQVLICTHSASFLKGVLDGKSPAGIFRLNRKKDETRFIPITAEATRQMSVNPILSSQRVMEGIFHKGVVVCEADADRSVYQSVASICHQSNGEVLFVHAHNKQTLAMVIDALRKAGIPCAAVADIDILHGNNDIGAVYQALTQYPYGGVLEAMRSQIDTFVENRPEEDIFDELKESLRLLLQQLDNGQHDFEGAKSATKRIYKDTGKWSIVKKEGVGRFDEEHRQIIDHLMEELRQIGLFVVPVGELEGWMDLGLRKGKWIVSALMNIQEGKTPEPLKLFVKSILDYINSGDRFIN